MVDQHQCRCGTFLPVGATICHRCGTPIPGEPASGTANSGASDSGMPGVGPSGGGGDESIYDVQEFVDSPVERRESSSGLQEGARKSAGGSEESIYDIEEFFDSAKKTEQPPGPSGASASVREAPVAAETGIARRMLEALVDPRAIEWLLILGGTLATIGLVVWLVSIGVFDDPFHKAVGFGLGTAGLLGLGWWVTLKTRFRLAGEALTFLACVVAPLNLWFYHAQGLLRVDEGLWMAGVVCCGLYAATAVLLKRPRFLYAFQAGITLVALLFLADIGTLRASSVAMCLALLGLLFAHLERAFDVVEATPEESYGRPLFRGGLAIFGGGLLLLIPAQVWGWLDPPGGVIDWLIAPRVLEIKPAIAALVWLMGAYLSVYVLVFHLRLAHWGSLAGAACLVMAEITWLVGIGAKSEWTVVALGVSSLAASYLGAMKLREFLSGRLRGAGLALVGFGTLPLVLGYVLLARATMPSFAAWGWHRPMTFEFPLAMAILTLCHAASSYFLREFFSTARWLRLLTAGAALLAVAGAAWLTPMPGTFRLAALGLVPLGYLVGGIVRKDSWDVSIGHVLGLFLGGSLFLGVAHQGPEILIPKQGSLATLGAALVLLEATLLLLLSAGHAESQGKRTVATLLSLLAVGTSLASVWELLVYLGWGHRFGLEIFLAVGVVAIGASYLMRSLSRPTRLVGVGVLVLTTLGADLRGVERLVSDAMTWRMLADLAQVIAACFLGSWLVPGKSERRVLLTGAALTAALMAASQLSLIELTMWQGVEIVAIFVGLLMVASAHHAYFRSGPLAVKPEDQNLFDVGMWCGSLLMVLPLGVATFVGRFMELNPRLPDEIGLVVASVLLLATGVAWRFKATTLIGGASLLSYLIVLLAALLRRPEVTMGAILTGVGVGLFLVGLLLSIYRDYLLSLPDKIQRREGLFQILTWR